LVTPAFQVLADMKQLLQQDVEELQINDDEKENTMRHLVNLTASDEK